ncbi:hypothetical protein [Stomatohabitans albus]|uniref:hypothetical protein n=1 Tax=Stomatohabitans albus TaxID=3110766 RepID=UPI00300D23F0
MQTHENNHQALSNRSFALAVTQLSSPLRLNEEIQSLMARCGDHPIIGGHYGAWIHGLLPVPGSLVIFQDPNRAIPLSVHPSIQVRHDRLHRRARVSGQLVSLIDVTADMVTFAHSDDQAIAVTKTYLSKGGDPQALAKAIAQREGRVHETAMYTALDTYARHLAKMPS